MYSYRIVLMSPLCASLLLEELAGVPHLLFVKPASTGTVMPVT
jgi:hypothetical protein